MSHPPLYFIRHGETDWNAEGRLQGQHDTPLNKVGIGQAMRCGDILRALLERDGRDFGSFDYVASPLDRARKTMELVRGALALDPAGYRTDARLAELSFGRWEGFTFAELKARQADMRALATREHDEWGFVPPGGESYADLLVRVSAWHASITCDTIVVSHGGVARALVAHFEVEPQAAAPIHSIEQGVVYRFAPRNLTRFS